MTRQYQPRWARTAAWVLATVFAASCRAPEADVQGTPPPTLLSRTDHFKGSPLSGRQPAQPGEFAKAPRKALRATAEIRWIRGDVEPVDPFVLLATRARLVFRTRGQQTLFAAPRFSERAFAGVGDPAVEAIDSADEAGFQSTEIAFLEGAVLPGATTEFELVGERTFEALSMGLVRRRVRLLLALDANPEAGPQVGLVVDDFDASEGEPGQTSSMVATTPDDSAAPADSILQEEFVLLQNNLPPDGTPLVMAVRSPFGEGVYAAVIRVNRPPEQGARAEQHARIVAGAIRQIGQPLHDDHRANLEARALRDAIRALSNPDAHRVSLAFLGRRTGAGLTEDIALVGDDATVARVAEALSTSPALRSLRVDNPLLEPERMGAHLELIAIDFLAREKTAARIPPELDAALLRHLGEIGRLPRVMRDLARTKPDTTATLEAALIAENRSFLEDIRTSARVRAYRWLEERGFAPAGFDPLGPRFERRRALQAAKETESQ